MLRHHRIRALLCSALPLAEPHALACQLHLLWRMGLALSVTRPPHDRDRLFRRPADLARADAGRAKALDHPQLCDESRTTFRLQVHGVLCSILREPGRAVWLAGRRGHPPYRSAGRDLLLYIPVTELHDRRLSWKPEGSPLVRGLRPLRLLLPSTRGGTDRTRHASRAPADSAAHPAPGSDDRGALAHPLGPLQEGRHRG